MVTEGKKDRERMPFPETVYLHIFFLFEWEYVGEARGGGIKGMDVVETMPSTLSSKTDVLYIDQENRLG